MPFETSGCLERGSIAVGLRTRGGGAQVLDEIDDLISDTLRTRRVIPSLLQPSEDLGQRRDGRGSDIVEQDDPSPRVLDVGLDAFRRRRRIRRPLRLDAPQNQLCAALTENVFAERIELTVGWSKKDGPLSGHALDRRCPFVDLREHLIVRYLREKEMVV